MYKCLLQGYVQIRKKLRKEISNRAGIKIQKDNRVWDPDHIGRINLPSEKVILFLVREKEGV